MNTPPFPQAFHTTRWTVVRQAAGVDEPAAAQALSTLCESYWHPVYAFIRRSGKNAHDAEDLTQGFFAQLLDRRILAKADPDKGSLRNFLLTCARRYVVDQHDRDMAQKRGAGGLVSFDAQIAEQTYATEPVDDLTPDRIFQRRWALTLVDHCLDLLRQEYAADGKAGIFETLRPFLGFGPDPEKRYDEIATASGVPVATLKTRVFKLRQRWRALLFEQVAATLDAPTEQEIKAELGELLTCM